MILMSVSIVRKRQPCSSDGESGHGEDAHVAVVGGDGLELLHGGPEAGGGCPDVAVMAADYSFLHFLQLYFGKNMEAEVTVDK